MRAFWLLLLIVLPGAAWAHHSGAAVYIPTQTHEIRGEIVEIFWRNPHVHFLVDIANDNGVTERWDVESNSVSVLSRMGITADVVQVGDRVGFAGWPPRRPIEEMFATNLLLANGEEVLLLPGAGAHWNDATRGSAIAWVTDGGTAAPEASARGLFRVWSTNMANPASFPLFNDVVSVEQDYPLTPAARAAREAWDPIADNPYLSCTPMGMPRVMGQPYPIEFVDRGEEILLRIELHDLERSIIMDPGPLGPEDDVATPLGYSEGRWEGETLVVTTQFISWPYFDQSGVPLGPDARVEERFTPSEDGSRLDYTLTVTDPDTFTRPVTLGKYWTWRAGERIQPFDCAEFEG